MGNNVIVRMSKYVAVLCALIVPCRQDSSLPIVLRYDIREETKEGTFVGNLLTGSGLADKYPQDVLNELRFRYLSQPSVNLNLEMTTGALITGDKIDREAICAMEVMCEIKFDVVIQAARLFQLVKVTVKVEDINDNYPIFSERRVRFELSESSAIGATLILPSATDPDSPMFAIQSYELEDHSDKFVLRIQDKMDGSIDLKLQLQKQLDREIQGEYALRVIAYDGGGLSGSTEVIISVTDANDNDPVFYNSTYSVVIAENIPIDASIVTVQAGDRDIGANGEIVYQFSTRTQDKFGHLFKVNPDTGVITVHGLIDYEQFDLFHLAVVAKDKGQGSLAADATVVVKVQDVNDNAPLITINTLTDAATTTSEVQEGSDMGTFVAHVTVSDKDKGDNGRFECFLNDNHFRLEEFLPTEFQIVTAMQLDREARDEFDLLVECADNGEPRLISAERLRVLVADKNDHSPSFDRARYVAEISENNYEGAFILQANATDKDQGANSEIRYSLSPEVSSVFQIDPVRGRLTARVPLDRERNEEIRFHVTAEDQGTPKKSGSVEVVVIVKDVNDEKPIFTQETYSFTVDENQAAGAIVGNVSAYDRDAPPFDRFYYSLNPTEMNHNIFDSFVIDQNTGTIRTKQPLDREQMPTFRFLVRATDYGDRPLNNSANVIVYIADSNDNEPRILYPSPDNNTASVSGLAPVGYSVTRIIADDDDALDRSKLRYEISEGNEEHMFNINGNNGVITVNKLLMNNVREKYDILVTVSDNGVFQHTVSQRLYILVNKSAAPSPASGKQRNFSFLGDFLYSDNFILVICLASISGIIAIVLIIAIIAIVYRRRRRPAKQTTGSYNCRKEEEKKILQNHTNEYDEGKPIESCTPNGYYGGTLNRSKKQVGDEEQHSHTQQLPTQISGLQNHAPDVILTAKSSKVPDIASRPTGKSHKSDKPRPTGPPSEVIHALRKPDADNESSLSADSLFHDSGRGTGSECDLAHHTTHHGGRRQQLPAEHSTLPGPASSYNRRKPDFKTFSPLNSPGAPVPRSDRTHGADLLERIPADAPPNYYIVSESHDGLHHAPSSSPSNGRRPPKAISPASTLTRRGHEDGPVSSSHTTRDDHKSNSYRPGFKVDPDDVSYDIDAFALNNCKEECV